MVWTSLVSTCELDLRRVARTWLGLKGSGPLTRPHEPDSPGSRANAFADQQHRLLASWLGYRSPLERRSEAAHSLGRPFERGLSALFEVIEAPTTIATRERRLRRQRPATQAPDGSTARPSRCCHPPTLGMIA